MTTSSQKLPPLPKNLFSRLERTQWIILGTAVGIVLILAFLYRGFVRETIVLPILYLVWLAGLVLGSINQALLWGLLVLIVIILIFRTVLRGTGISPGNLATVHTGERNGRVAYWKRQLSITNRAEYLKDDFRTSLSRLIYQTIASQYRITALEAETKVKNGELSIPEQVLAFLKEGPNPLRAKPTGFGARFDALLSRFDHQDKPEQLIDPSWVVILDYLESQMENEDDRSNE
jgi:hypothetical protein